MKITRERYNISVSYAYRKAKKEIDREKLASINEVAENNLIFFSNQVHKNLIIEEDVETIGKTYFDKLNNKNYE